MKKTIYPVADFKTTKVMCKSANGLIRVITYLHIDSMKLTLIDNNFSLLRGFKSRNDMLIRMGWERYSDLDLYHNEKTNKIQTFKDIEPACLN